MLTAWPTTALAPALALQPGIGLAERLTPEKALIGRKRRRMYRFQYQVLPRINQLRFLAGIGAPEDEHNVLLLLRNLADNRVGKFFPAFFLVRGGLAGAHRERGIQEQHALLRPSGRGCRWGRGRAGNIGLQLLENIDAARAACAAPPAPKTTGRAPDCGRGKGPGPESQPSPYRTAWRRKRGKSGGRPDKRSQWHIRLSQRR